jgi:DNA-binding beta-propeller fold protein YncE
VANRLGGTVTELRGSDGMSLGTFTVGTGPSGVAFDGANVWVVNFNSGTVSKL